MSLNKEISDFNSVEIVWLGNKADEEAVKDSNADLMRNSYCYVKYFKLKVKDYSNSFCGEGAFQVSIDIAIAKYLEYMVDYCFKKEEHQNTTYLLIMSPDTL